MQTALLQPCRSARPFQGRATRSRRQLTVRAEADSSGLLAAAAALPLVAASGIAAWKLTTYGQLEYITAAMLTNYVPKDGSGARIVQLQGSTRELFYYPKSTVQVTVVGEGIKKELMERAGLQASVPTVAKVQSPANLGFAADGSVDAVVSLGALTGMSDAQRTAFAVEALRVLKPGCPIIFVERIPGGLPVRFIGTSNRTLAESYLQGWKQRSDAFELVQWDVALEGQDPHAVGVAVKVAEYRVPVPSRRAEKAAEKVERERASKEARRERDRIPKKGFDSGGAIQ